MAFNDDVVDAGGAFMGMAISSGGGIGNVQLWNPYGTGKLLYVDRLLIAGDADVGADVRYTDAAFGSVFADHIRNKRIDGAASVAEIRTQTSNPPSNYPYNRPCQEIWLGGTNNDRTYIFDPAIVVPQGRGLLVGMANSSKCIASFQWREKTDPLGVVTGSGGGGGSGTLVSCSDGTIVSNNLTNASNAFDGNSGTYATDPNDGNNTNYYIGKTWGSSKTIIRFLISSEPGRSFSAANPGRVLTWTFEKYDGTSWTTHQTGSYTEPGTGSTQSVIDITLTTACAALGHRIKITESAVSTQHVGSVEFYT